MSGICSTAKASSMYINQIAGGWFGYNISQYCIYKAFDN